MEDCWYPDKKNQTSSADSKTLSEANMAIRVAYFLDFLSAGHSPTRNCRGQRCIRGRYSLECWPQDKYKDSPYPTGGIFWNSSTLYEYFSNKDPDLTLHSIMNGVVGAQRRLASARTIPPANARPSLPAAPNVAAPICIGNT